MSAQTFIGGLLAVFPGELVVRANQANSAAVYESDGSERAEAAGGKPFIIAKAGKPRVKVTALDTPTGKQVRRLGFLRGLFSVPDDFNTMGSSEIEGMFQGKE